MIRTIFIIAAGIAFLYGMLTVGAPFLLALVVALLMEPIHAVMMRTLRMNRFVAVTVSSTLCVVFGGWIVYIGIVKAVSELALLVRNIDTLAVQQGIEKALDGLRALVGHVSADVLAHIEQAFTGQVQALQTITTRISAMLVSWVGSLPELMLTCVVFVISVYLFGYHLPMLKHFFLSFFETKSQTKVETVLMKLRQSVIGFFRAQFFLSSLTYVLTATGLWILDVRHLFVIALLIMIVDVLPILGTGSVLVPWAVYAFSQEETTLAVGLVVLFLVITVVRRAIEPKVLGDHLGIATLPTLMSLYIGFQIFGGVGLLLGPLLVIVYQAMVKVGLLRIRIRLEP
jgi:sporulation integral membrane protein YtvI